MREGMFTLHLIILSVVVNEKARYDNNARKFSTK